MDNSEYLKKVKKKDNDNKDVLKLFPEHVRDSNKYL